MALHKYHDIAVIYGSDSSEWEVSCRSGEFVSSKIDGTAYNVFEIFARFGKWRLVAYRMKDSERTVIPEADRPETGSLSMWEVPPWIRTRLSPES